MITKTDAILALDANAKVKIENDVVEWVDGNPNNITEEQISVKITELETDKANEEIAKATAKASGNQKLLDLGLTQAEATALTGYTPPVAE